MKGYYVRRLNYVSYVLSCFRCLVPYVFLCLTCLVPYVLSYLKYLLPYVPHVSRVLCLTCLASCLILCLTCLTYSCTSRILYLACSQVARASNSTFLQVFQASHVLIHNYIFLAPKNYKSRL